MKKKVAKTKVVTGVDAILAEREITNGPFEDFAKVENNLLDAVTSMPNWNGLDPVIKSAIRMNLHKVSRIVVGDPYALDHYRDTQGYMRRAERYIEQKVK